MFLHEGLGSVSLWRDFPAALCRRTSCSGLVYSRRGHGASDPLDGPRTVRFMHEEALGVLPALLDAFSIRRPILIGHSDGGSIALIYEGSRIGRSAGLILEAPHVFVEDRDVVLEVAFFHGGRQLRRHWHNPTSVGQKGVETEISKEVI